jgi:DNA-binding PadR family transcriptional regulator
MILTVRDPVVREFLLAFWKIHILHHAGERGVYGQWMLEELHYHGYRLSPGTLYPMLARMAARGWLRASEPSRSRGPRLYRLTPRGREVLDQIRGALDELYREAGASTPATNGRHALTPTALTPPQTPRKRPQAVRSKRLLAVGRGKPGPVARSSPR